MSTFRTLSLTATGLLLSLGAAAQSTGLSPANEDMLSWMLHVLLGAVGIVAALASIALLTAAANRSSLRQEQAAAAARLAAPTPALETAAAPATNISAPIATAVAPALAPIVAQEPVLSE